MAEIYLNKLQTFNINSIVVSSDEVEIDHNATISGLNEDYLFYLNSKGLSKEEASKLITKGFLMNKLELSNEVKDNLF